MILGATPIASSPLASARQALAAVSGALSATGGLTFGGAGTLGARVHLTAAGGLAFAGTGTAYVRVYRTATGGFTFGGNPLLRVAGEPVVFVALTDSYVIRSESVAFEFTSPAEQFTFRGNG